MAGERILVIDDDAIICTLLKDTLSDEGYHVETVTNGTEGLEKLLRGEPFDILITDIRMPKKNGTATSSGSPSAHWATRAKSARSLKNR